jgi:hypothetical protein
MVTSMLSLRVLILYKNELSGYIPETLGDLPNLEHLDLSFNKFAGPVPASLGKLLALRDLHLENNSLTGGYPWPNQAAHSRARVLEEDGFQVMMMMRVVQLLPLDGHAVTLHAARRQVPCRTSSSVCTSCGASRPRTTPSQVSGQSFPLPTHWAMHGERVHHSSNSSRRITGRPF